MREGEKDYIEVSMSESNDTGPCNTRLTGPSAQIFGIGTTFLLLITQFDFLGTSTIVPEVQSNYIVEHLGHGQWCRSIRNKMLNSETLSIQ